MTLAQLTTRQRQIAVLIGQRMSCQAIARHLGCSPRTINSHVRSIADQLRQTDDLDLPALRLVRRWVLRQAA